MNKKIHGKDLKPGDLVYSKRTDQAMFVISNKHTATGKTKLIWFPLTGRGEIFSVEISHHTEYIIL